MRGGDRDLLAGGRLGPFTGEDLVKLQGLEGCRQGAERRRRVGRRRAAAGVLLVQQLVVRVPPAALVARRIGPIDGDAGQQVVALDAGVDPPGNTQAPHHLIDIAAGAA